ncbi:MAG: hypothetical protein WC872_01735 [Candidatus Absconditabacterales bacterium]
MGIFFEILKGIFFFLTVIVGIFFLRGEIILNSQYYDVIKQFLMPGYLIFCGIMIGYIISRIRLGYDDEHPDKHKIYINSFLIGIIIGVILAIIYMLVSK